MIYIIISSGGVLCAAYFGKKYEEILPITCAGIVLIMFLFGVAGLLTLGVLVVCGISALLYILSFVRLYKTTSWKDVLCNTFTPAFFVFFIFYIGVSCFNYGKLAYVVSARV